MALKKRNFRGEAKEIPFKFFYIAGWCFLVGLFEQGLTHKFERRECLLPQNLQVY
jgi:hypothetical protein